MSREQFIEYLSRSVEDGFLDEQEAIDLLARFDAGELDEDDYPAPLNEVIEDTDEEYMLALWLKIQGIALIVSIAMRGARRDQRQDEYQATMRSLAVKMSRNELSIAEWSRQSSMLTRDYMLEMAMMGKAAPLNPIELQRVNTALKQEQARVTRMADDVASRRMITDAALDKAGLSGKADELLKIVDQAKAEDAAVSRIAPDELRDDAVIADELDERMSEKLAGARAEQLGGPGRGVWFKSIEIEDPNVLYNYFSVDDDGTCEPCLQAELDGPYQAEDGPYPGEVCLGGGRCRCVRVPETDAEAAARLRAA